MRLTVVVERFTGNKIVSTTRQHRTNTRSFSRLKAVALKWATVNQLTDVILFWQYDLGENPNGLVRTQSKKGPLGFSVCGSPNAQAQSPT